MGASGFARKAIEYFDLTADDMKTTRDITVGPPLKFKRRPGAAAEPGENIAVSAAEEKPASSASPASGTQEPRTSLSPSASPSFAADASAPAISSSGAANSPAPALPSLSAASVPVGLSPSGAASAPAPAAYPSAAERAATPVSASAGGAPAPEKAAKSSTFGQWAALFAGVMIQPSFQAYQATHKWAFDGLGGWAFFALITSVLIFPAVYRNAFDKDKPVVLQLAPIFAAGLGWQSLLTTAIKAAGH